MHKVSIVQAISAMGGNQNLGQVDLNDQFLYDFAASALTFRDENDISEEGFITNCQRAAAKGYDMLGFLCVMDVRGDIPQTDAPYEDTLVMADINEMTLPE